MITTKPQGSSLTFQSLKQNDKENSNLILFLNELKHRYKLDLFCSNLDIIDTLFNILSQVITFTRLNSNPNAKARLSEKQVLSTKTLLEKDISTFLHYLRDTKTISPSNSIDKPISFTLSRKDMLKGKEKTPDYVMKLKSDLSMQSLSFKTAEKENINKQSMNHSNNKGKGRPLNRSSEEKVKQPLQQQQKHNKRNVITVNAYHPPVQVGKNKTVKRYNSSLGQGTANSRNNSEISIGSLSSVIEKKDNKTMGDKGINSKEKEKDKGDIKPSIFANKLVSQFHNVIDKYYSIKNEDDKYKTFSGKVSYM